MKRSEKHAPRSAVTSNSITAADPIPVLTGVRPIRSTSISCLFPWQPKPGRCSTYRNGKTVQTNRASSLHCRQTCANEWSSRCINIHLRHDPTAHVRRLEAIRRLGGQVERETDGSWKISPDHLERAAVFERSQAQFSPVTVETLSMVPLQRQTGIEGATWLDRELVAEKARRSSGLGLRAGGPGCTDAARAMAHRTGFCARGQDRTLYRGNMLTQLRDRELSHVAGQLSGELLRASIGVTSIWRADGSQ
jgi:hypothetical protein